MTLLLDSMLKTSIVLVITLGAAGLLRRQSAAVRHWIVAAAVLCALAMPLLIVVAPAWEVPSIPVGAPAVDTRVEFSIPGAPQPVVPPRSATDSTGRFDFLTAVGIAWVAGTAAAIAMLIVGLWRLRAIRAAASRAPAGDRIAGMASAMARDHGVRRPIRLLYGSDPSFIATWGALRPTVVLPSAAREWPDDRLRVVLCHELAHVRRGDWGIQAAADLLRAFHWFNPLAWAACRVLRRESEQACDDAVLCAGVEGPAYAAELLVLARAAAPGRAAWAPALPVARPSGLERRVRVMLNAHVNRLPLTPRTRTATILATVVIAAAIAGGGALAQGPFATVSGSLLDPQRAPLPGATAVITNTKTQAKNEVRSDRNGRFELVGLPPGDYVLDVTVAGFSNHRAEMTLSGEHIDRDIVMRVGTLQETISVTAGPAAGLVTVESDDARERRMARRQNAPCAQETGQGSGGNIRPPMKIRDVRPVYPAALADIHGTVNLEALIGVDGSVRDVTVTTPAHPALDASAMEAVRQWQFTETLLNCVPIEVAMNVTVNFTAARR